MGYISQSDDFVELNRKTLKVDEFEQNINIKLNEHGRKKPTNNRES